MDKDTFFMVLQSALLSFQGATLQEMHTQYGINPHIAKVGVELSNYLKQKEINNGI